MVFRASGSMRGSPDSMNDPCPVSRSPRHTGARLGEPQQPVRNLHGAEVVGEPALYRIARRFGIGDVEPGRPVATGFSADESNSHVRSFRWCGTECVPCRSSQPESRVRNPLRTSAHFCGRRECHTPSVLFSPHAERCDTSAWGPCQRQRRGEERWTRSDGSSSSVCRSVCWCGRCTGRNDDRRSHARGEVPVLRPVRGVLRNAIQVGRAG